MADALMMRDEDPRQDYWWAQTDEFRLVSQLQPYNDNGNASFGNNPIMMSWFRNTLIYYSNVIAPSNWDTSLVFKGKQGELIQMLVPMSRSLIRQIVGVVTKTDIYFRVLCNPSSVQNGNDGPNIMETARLGNALCKDIVKNQFLDLKYADSIENGMLHGMAFMYVRWRTDKGPIHTKDQQGVQHFKGDLCISVPTVWDVNFDHNIPDPKDWQWVQVREIHNRWDLIAQLPDMKEAILNLPSVRQSQGWFNLQGNKSPSDDDLVYIWNAYHKPTPALPDGRYIAYGSPDCVLYDDINHYGELPVYVSRPEAIPNSGLGYPFFSNLVPLQEMFDTCLSSIATNNSAFGVQNVLAPRGAGINTQAILGMNFISYTPQPGIPNGGKPEPLQLTQSSPETYKFTDMLKGLMMEISQVNAALRGNPPPQVSSGTAIATLTATAYETINSTAKSSRQMLREVMLGSINCYRRFASVERSLATSDVGGQSVTTSFVGSHLDPIKSVDLQEVNPLMQTLSGRLEIADKVLQQGLVTNLKGYFAVMEGAPPEELYKNELSQEDLVNRENEALIKGEEVKVLNIDDHAYHLMMHSIPLNDPKVRLNKELAGRFLSHILEHSDQARQIDPFFAAMVQTGKMPEGGPPPPPMMGPPGMGAPPGQGGPPGAEGPMGARGGGPPPPGTSAGPAKPAMDQLSRASGG
jgi:hypothetical protein